VRLRVKKAYPAYFGTYAEFGKVRRWLDGFANLYCIGRNGQHRYNNMDHSMLCGVEAARALLSGAADKSSVWNVNTEEEYHEGK
jgi:protoporphyrinogen oxidase